MSVGSFTIHHGDSVHYSLSAVWVRPPVGTYPCPSFKGIDSVFDCTKSITSGIGDLQYPSPNKLLVKVYPNPVHNILNIEYKGILTNTTLIITDVLGNTLTNTYINNHTDKTILNINNWNTGIYFYKLISQNGQTVSGNFVIIH